MGRTCVKMREADAPPDIVAGVEKYFWSDGTFWFQTEKKFPTAGRQYFNDLNDGAHHPGPPYWEPGPVGIWTTRDGGLTLANVGSYSNASGTRVYDGGFFPSGGSYFNLFGATMDNTVKQNALDFTDPENWGPEAWSKFAPGKSSADVGQFIGEMKDVPKMLATTAKGFASLWRGMGGSKTGFGPKHVADHWLNTQFGWLPFVSDVRRFYQTWRSADDRIARIKKHNGKWERRSGSVRDVEETAVVGESSITSHWPIPDGSLLGSTGTTGHTVIHSTEIEQVWFSGLFRYYIPDIGSVKWNKKARRLLYGASVNPHLLWELTPWSWLLDWFSNMGDNFANMDDGWAENLVGRNACVMAHRHRGVSLTSTLNMRNGPLNAVWDYYATRKARAIASPFGFHLTMDDLSPRQISILSALGISRR